MIGFAVVVVVALFASTSTATADNIHGSNEAGSRGPRESGFNTADGSITVPQFTCPSSVTDTNTFGMAWLSLNSAAVAGFVMTVECHNGVLALSADVRVQGPNDSSPRITPFPSVHAGDVLKAHFSYQINNGVARVGGHNLTTGDRVAAHFRVTGITWSYVVMGLGSYIGEFRPVPAFDRIHFGGLLLDGQPAATSATLQAYDDYNGDHLLIHTTKFNPGGRGFNLEFVASS